MNRDFDFSRLYVFDLANNHQGRLQHGLRIIDEIGAVVAANQVRGALKLQMRQLDSFVHPAHFENSPNKHIQRFLGTRLGRDDFRTLIDATRRAGMVTMCTPFDEESVDVIEDFDVEIVKIGSCSANDWPLLERVAEADKPVVFSTGGLTLKEIDDLVSFFDHRRVHFAIMHCVSIYPTPDDMLQLNQIDLLRNRYPTRAVGFSTHEHPDELDAVQIAVAKGAQLLERHVGVPTEDITLNAYSSEPRQIDAWIRAAEKARVMCGCASRPPAPEQELRELEALKRGVYARRPLKPGTALERADVYFAMPVHEGQLTAGEWAAGIVPISMVGKDEALCRAAVDIPAQPERQVLFTAIHSIKALLNEARIPLNTEFEAEFSHHYGLARFAEFGATIIECVNRSYCKKLLIQLPGQRHPCHYHKRKEETFQVLHGVLEMEVEGRRRTLYPGDTQLIQQGVWHEFWTDTGAVVEEISSTAFDDDSFYEDKEINRLGRAARKTLVNNWGRYQI
jgi:N-acetylneuraminate synthase